MWLVPLLLCAQRLLASRNRSPRTEARLNGELVACSTPAGITESITPTPPPSSLSTSPGAQRLLASRNRSLVDYLTLVGDASDKCSTPAGITESITSARPDCRARWGLVLNACWHHGIDHINSFGSSDASKKCSTPAGITESITSSYLHLPHRLRQLCSTPAGITESITPHTPSPTRSRCKVLNACWHHGIDHLRAAAMMARASCAQRLLASRNRSPSRRRRRPHRTGCAQRLLASRNRSLDAVRTFGGVLEVLNACWHHGIDHTTPPL